MAWTLPRPSPGNQLPPRRWLWAVVAPVAVALLLSAFVPALRGVRPALAPSAADAELLAVHAAVDDLRHEFFRPVAANDALNAAWDAAVAAARQASPNLDVPPRPLLGANAVAGRRNFDAAYQELDRRGAGHADPYRIGDAAIAGIASSVHENHTYFIDAEHWNHRGDASTQYAGIGITLSQQGGYFYVGEVYPESPAAHAGLRPGDRLAAVDGISVSTLQQDQLVAHLRGDPETTVSVAVERGEGSFQVVLQRQIVVVSAFESRILDGNVGYVRLRSFPPADAKLPGGRTTVQALDAALDAFDAARVTAWVLDLRNNGGGYLNSMTEVASRFLPANSPLLISRTQAGDQTSRTSGNQHRPGRPVAVLLNGGSASASEILAAALQEYGRGAVVGEKSAGVANAANLDALPNGAGISVTSVQSLTPVLQRPLDGAGVTPDAVIGGSADDIPLGKDRQLERAAAVAIAGGLAAKTAGAQ